MNLANSQLLVFFSYASCVYKLFFFGGILIDASLFYFFCSVLFFANNYIHIAINNATVHIKQEWGIKRG